MGLPSLAGDPIFVAVQPALFTHRGRLVSGAFGSGTAVYAAAFLRQRKIVMESALLSNRTAFRLILMHELFHFVWPRLGNHVRQGFHDILLTERNQRARGELGESSSVRKALFRRTGSAHVWRDYVCESFCDTAAWLYAGVGENRLFTLRPRWKDRRRAWFQTVANIGCWKC